MAEKDYETVVGTVQTVDAQSDVVLVSFTLPENCVCVVECEALGITTGGLVTSWRFITVVKRATGNAVQPLSDGGQWPLDYQHGFREATLHDGSSNPIAKANVSATEVNLLVDGVLGETIDWQGEMRVQVN